MPVVAELAKPGSEPAADAASVKGKIEKPRKARSVTPVYRKALAAFFANEPMYHEGAKGWLYLPSSALLYWPFTLGPVWFGEALYRLVSTAFYAWAVWRVAIRASPRRAAGASGLQAADYFPVMTLLAIPVAAGAIRNGQMNIALGAAMAVGFCELAAARYVIAAAWLSLGVWTKPPGVVPALLAMGVTPKVRFIASLVIGMILSVAVMHVNLNLAYVREQFHQGMAKVLEAGGPDVGVFDDLGGALSTFQVPAPEWLMTGLRVGAAVGVWVLSLVALRRRERGEAWVIILTLCASYLMVFNPRTEGVSYPILMPGLAAVTCWALFKYRCKIGSPIMLAINLVMMTAQFLFPLLAKLLGSDGAGGDKALRPIATCLLMVILAVDVLTRKAQGTRQEA